jgi:hypothetical protein
MRDNVFSFGSQCFLQLLDGIVTGPSCACNYATIYYSYHEETNLLANNAHLLLFYHIHINGTLIIERASPRSFAIFCEHDEQFRYTSCMA